MYLVVSPHDLSYAVFGLLKTKEEGEERVKLVEVKTRPETILASLLTFLREQMVEPKALEGIVVVTGPGSFTSLRAGLSVVNTFAFVYGLPLISLPNSEGLDLETLISKTNFSSSQEFVKPFYGREPNVTMSKKKQAVDE